MQQLQPMQQLCAPLAPKAEGVPLRVIAVGRVSTVHQNEKSIEASHRYVENHLRQLYQGPLEITCVGERGSGMLVDRQSIRQIEDRISAGQVDLIIAEDLSRIFRNPRHQFNFVQDAVDANVRIIALADNLDTASESWELMLGTASLRHGFVVTDTRRRVRRTATHSFHLGGMVIKVPFGFKRLNKEEADSGHFGPQGLRLAKDPNCTCIIREMRATVLAGKPYAHVATWLNRERVHPGPYAKHGRWTAKLVADYLRNPLLHGERTFRNVIYQPVLRTGKHRRQANPNPERKAYLELAHLTVDEHAELLQAMAARVAARRRRIGKGHPRYRLPRSQSIWPAQHLVCQICGGLMYSYDKGQLKCSGTFSRGVHQCWNRVQVHAELVRRGALQCLWDFLQPLPGARDSFLDVCWKVVERSSTYAGQALHDVDVERRDLEQQADRLAKAIADGGELSALVKRLKDVQAAIEAVETRKGELRAKACQERQEISFEAFHCDPLPTLLDHCRKSYEFAEVLREVISEITVVPVQDLPHGQVRPRIKLRATFAVDGSLNNGSGAIVQMAAFDAFEKPQHIMHLDGFCEVKRDQPKASHAEIADALGISKDAVKRIVQYSRLMQENGVSEPYVELTSKPARASRWQRRNGHGTEPPFPDSDQTCRS